MTKSELETQIGFRIRTASRNSITATEITTELNRSLARLNSSIDLDIAIKTDTIAYTADGVYPLPTDFKKPIQLYDRTNNQGYKRVSVGGRIEAEDDGAYVYSITGSNISIESSAGTTTLTISYYSTNDAQSTGGTAQKGLVLATDEPLLANRFHDYFVEDVASILFRKQRKYEDYGAAKKERTSLLRQIEDSNPTYKETVVETFTPYSESYE